MHFHIHDSKISITHRSESAALVDVLAAFRRGEGFALATLNLDHLVKMRQDEGFQSAYMQQDMVVADGNPIVWLARLAGQRIELAPGSDLLLPLCHLAAAQGLPVSMFGATEAALQQASAALAIRIPDYRPGLLIAPPMGFDPEGDLARNAAEQLAALGPQLCLIALGAPKQEKFAAFARKIAPQTGFASIGAGIEFISGHQTRAPRWMRAMALEWLWRAGLAPRRMVPRYLACLSILPSLVRDAVRQR